MNRGGDRMSDFPFRRRAFLKAGAGGLSLAGLSTAVSATDNPWDVEVSVPDGQKDEEGWLIQLNPGEQATVDLTLEVTGSEPIQYVTIGLWAHPLAIIIPPEEIEVIDRTGGNSDQPLRWEDLEPGDVVEGAYTIEIVDDASAGRIRIDPTTSWGEVEDDEDWTFVDAGPDAYVEIETPEPELELTAEGDETVPGEQATAEFTLTNTGEATAEDLGIQLGGTPMFDPDWEFVEVWGTPATVGELIEHPDAGVFAVSDGFWDVSDLDPGESQTLTITFEAPDDVEPGEYEVEGYELDEPDVEATAIIEVEGEEEPAELELTAEGDETTPGGEATVEFFLSNTGEGTADVASIALFMLFEEAGTDFEIVDVDPDDGEWLDDLAWEISDLEPTDTQRLAVTFEVPDDPQHDAYEIDAEAFLTRPHQTGGEPPEDDATAVIEIEETDSVEISVVDIDDRPIEGATIRMYGRKDNSYDDENRHDVSRYGRFIAERKTDSEGIAGLPTRVEKDDEILVTIRKGDWFKSSTFMPDTFASRVDERPFVLNRQLLCDPVTVSDDDNHPFGTVTVWRYMFDEETQVFFTEVTNTNKRPGYELWKISEHSAFHGIEGGIFLFAFPNESASLLDDHESPFGMQDPTGDGGEHVFVTHPPTVSVMHDPTMAGILHPGRDSSVGLPLYETTKTLGRYGEYDGPSVEPGWHVVSPESVEEAEELRGRVESSMVLVDLPLDMVNLPGLVDILERLDFVTDMLEDPSTAEVNKTPEMPITDGKKPYLVSKGWEYDNPDPFGQSYEMSSVYQVPLQVDDNEQLAVTIRTEWSRDQGNAGVFSATFGTGDLDITSVKLGEANGQEGGTIDGQQSSSERTIAATLRNRSTEQQSPTEIVFDTGESVVSLSPDDPPLAGKFPLEPGQTVTIEQSVDLSDADTSEILPTVAVEAENGTATQRTQKLLARVTGDVIDSNNEPIPDAEIEALAAETATTESTTQTGTDGTYSLGLPAGNEYELVATAPGYETKETTISVEKDTTHYEDLILIPDEEMSVSAIRSIESETLEPGEQTTVTVDVELTDDGDGALFEQFDPAFEAVGEVSASGPIVEEVADDELEVGWLSDLVEDPATTDTVEYVVTAPETTEDLEIEFTGEIRPSSDDEGVPVEGPDTITVLAPEDDSIPPVVGNDPPRDLDGDGLYEDVNGDGSADVVDVQALTRHLESDVVQNHSEAFNFSDGNPNEVTAADVEALYARVTGGEDDG